MVVSHKTCFLMAFVVLCGATSAQSKKDSVWIQTQDGCKIYNPNPKKNERISWTGSCVDGYAGGEGTLVWYKDDKPNQTYTGAMKRGSPHGYGKYDYGTGTTYEGNYLCGMKEGTGRIIYSDKRGVYYTYEGVFKNGNFEGAGTEIYYDRGDTTSIYKGDFLNDERHGHGVLREFSQYGFVVAEGTFYEGKLQDNQAEIREYGAGILLSDYKGGYRNDGRNGYGEEIMGLNKYEGQWQNSKKQGTGKLIYNGVMVYDGEWKDGKFDGVGTRVFLDGSKYKGQFNSNDRHGFGVMQWKDGASYIGEFKHDLFSGKGYTVYQNNKLNTAGTWEKGNLTVNEDVVPLRKFLETRYKDLFQRLNN